MLVSEDSLPEGFVLTAHRGAVDRAPENTILAFTEAEELGFQEIEFDVQQTRDGQLVIGHDRRPDRLALAGDPTNPLVDATLAELQQLDLGLGQSVPTFHEVLDATTVNLQVEIKEPRAARQLALALGRRSAADRDRCVVTSFHPHALAQFQGYATPSQRGLGLLVASLDTDWRHTAQSLGVTNLFLHWPGLTRGLVDDLTAAGYRVCASMFNNAGELRRILETGVVGSSTDRPLLAQALLAEIRQKEAPCTQ